MSFKSVQAAGEKMQAELRESGLDVLCNNAGIMGFGDKATEDGCDIQMQTNHLSHFLLTYLCLPLLGKAASLRGEARVINHSSCARVIDGPEFGDQRLQEKYLQKNGGNLGGDSNTIMRGANFVRYQQSKLANVVFTYALHERLQKQGSKESEVWGKELWMKGLTISEVLGGPPGSGSDVPDAGHHERWGYQSEEDGAVGILRNACDPEAKSGEFYGPLGKGGATGSHDSGEYKGPVGVLKKEPLADAEAQDMLWAASEAPCGPYLCA
ncbi:unnamed protein product [Symbiodinium pilosum]|uniref:Protochlorophyllide reductase n=1 Tax=Symbiodinium pilosum TaxID=2952 RepID=A0A812XR47_SYMPI|nr:unnamed protein product [Symbiodinium pilosum]